MSDRKEARQAVADDLRAFADDLKAFVQDPKERARKERQWRALYGILAIGFTMASRKLAAKAWSILTGEQPPTKGQPSQGIPREPTKEPVVTGSRERG